METVLIMTDFCTQYRLQKIRKIRQLADDTSFYLDKLKDIPIVMNFIEEFGQHSSLKLNEDKTEGLLTGRLKPQEEKALFKIKFKLCVKGICVYFGTNKATCQILNLEQKLNNCQKEINQ